MNLKALNTFLGAAIIGTALTLTGCGGGGSSSSGGSASVSYSGSTSAAVIDQNNASTISVASGVAVQKAANSLNASFGVSISTTSSSQLSANDANQTVTNALVNYGALNMPAGVTQTGACGGSVSSTTAPPSSGSGPWSGTATFSNYCISGGSSGNTIMNGTVVFNFGDMSTPSVNSTLQFSNYSIQMSGHTYTLDSVTVTCGSSSCDYERDYLDSDGSIYRTANVSITGDGSTTPYNGSMTFYDPNDGHVLVTVSGITYGQCGNYPDGGSITIQGSSGGAATINFYPPSPCTYSGTYNLAGGANGTFSGNTP
jgi:hypothetical protein